MPPFMKVHVHWMNLMKNQIICFFFKILKFERKGLQGKKTHLSNHLIKNLCLMGSKCLALDVGRHICRK
jgi:hypothetical protein